MECWEAIFEFSVLFYLMHINVRHAADLGSSVEDGRRLGNKSWKRLWSSKVIT